MLTLGLVFWILMIIWAIFSFPGNSFSGTYGPWGSYLLVFVLFGLLGWRVFGAAIG